MACPRSPWWVQAGIPVYKSGFRAHPLDDHVTLYPPHSLVFTQQGLLKCCLNCLLKYLERSNFSYTLPLARNTLFSYKYPPNILSAQSVPQCSSPPLNFHGSLTVYKTHWHWPHPVLFCNLSFLCALFLQQDCKSIEDRLCLPCGSLCSRWGLGWRLAQSRLSLNVW